MIKLLFFCAKFVFVFYLIDYSLSYYFYSSLSLDNRAYLYKFSAASLDLALPLGPLPILGLNNY